MADGHLWPRPAGGRGPAPGRVAALGNMLDIPRGPRLAGNRPAATDPK